jgi:hypothetical protein
MTGGQETLQFRNFCKLDGIGYNAWFDIRFPSTKDRIQEMMKNSAMTERREGVMSTVKPDVKVFSLRSPDPSGSLKYL